MEQASDVPGRIQKKEMNLPHPDEISKPED